MSSLASLCDRLGSVRVLVIGDVMLDEYLWGDATRISPEAPVPVVEVRRRTEAAGGAANAAAAIAALHGRVALGGVRGDDYHGRQLAAALAAASVEADGVFAVAGRPTTTKTRVVAAGQQIVRADLEVTTPLDSETEAAVLKWMSAAFAHADSVVISDYGKGFVTDRIARSAIELARATGAPLVVDSKTPDLSTYRGATVVTPNIREAERASGMRIMDEKSLRSAACSLVAALDGGSVLLTRGADGMSLFEPDRRAPRHISGTARAVYDVTGAGDTVTAVVAMALGAGASLLQAARLANLAAGLVVEKAGTASASREELLAASSHHA